MPPNQPKRRKREEEEPAKAAAPAAPRPRWHYYAGGGALLLILVVVAALAGAFLGVSHRPIQAASEAVTEEEPEAMAVLDEADEMRLIRGLDLARERSLPWHADSKQYLRQIAAMTYPGRASAGYRWETLAPEPDRELERPLALRPLAADSLESPVVEMSAGLRHSGGYGGAGTLVTPAMEPVPSMAAEVSRPADPELDPRSPDSAPLALVPPPGAESSTATSAKGYNEPGERP